MTASPRSAPLQMHNSALFCVIPSHLSVGENLFRAALCMVTLLPLLLLLFLHRPRVRDSRFLPSVSLFRPHACVRPIAAVMQYSRSARCARTLVYCARRSVVRTGDPIPFPVRCFGALLWPKMRTCVCWETCVARVGAEAGGAEDRVGA